jgi:beta-galactosidase
LVPTADHAVTVEVSGEGRLLGMCNGDPSSHEAKKTTMHHTFNGLAMAIVQSTERAGEIQIRVSSSGLAPATAVLRASRCKMRPKI